MHERQGVGRQKLVRGVTEHLADGRVDLGEVRSSRSQIENDPANGTALERQAESLVGLGGMVGGFPICGDIANRPAQPGRRIQRIVDDVETELDDDGALRHDE